MHPPEAARRRPVWEALSDLFLDTETRWYLPRIAWVLVQSEYSKEELEQIWRFEVVPSYWWNLFDIAGEWGGFPMDEKSLLKRARRRPGWLRKLIFPRLSPLADPLWQGVLQLREILLTLQEPNQRPAADAWTAFAAAYLEENLQRLFHLEDKLELLRSTQLPRQACFETFRTDFRPIYSEQLIGKEKAQEESRAENVLELIQLAFRNPDS
ncbi:MAG: hypothetical protein K0U98_18255 [Deltaproteobacteria bacterium]|nr:hypothetical protein [Deltaproteobacteria bacterium]